jgi:hypothetical protein
MIILDSYLDNNKLSYLIELITYKDKRKMKNVIFVNY